MENYARDNAAKAGLGATSSLRNAWDQLAAQTQTFANAYSALSFCDFFDQNKEAPGGQERCCTPTIFAQTVASGS